ncbi:MAG: hypothetical protein WCD76_12715, partial [Pyrinomonadaceae bacterium]
LADEAREVRAASARALSRLSFERADAYVRLIQTLDKATLGEVARACIKAGLTAQAVNRLASDDRRQAYESFSLLSLVIKGGEQSPVLDAVENHHDLNVRLAAVRLLGTTQQPESLDQLHKLAALGSVPEEVRSAILGIVRQNEYEAVEA